MGKFKSTYIEFEGQQQLVEGVIGRARYYAKTRRDYSMEIIIHLQDHAYQLHDDVLFDECRELMALAQSPSPYPIRSNHEHAGDANNRPKYEPTEPVEEPYDNSLDSIFDERVKVSEVKKALNKQTFKKKGRVEWYVVYKVLLHLKWLKENCTQKDFLQWVNLQYQCGWTKEQHFTFSRDVNGSMRNIDISLWNSKDYTKYTKREKYYNFAVLLRKTFEHIIVNGKETDDPITDFSIGKNRDKSSFMKHPAQFINTGK